LNLYERNDASLTELAGNEGNAMSGKKLLVRAMLLSMVWVISGCYRYVPVRV